MESWTEHLREETRLDEADRVALARATALHRSEEPPAGIALPQFDP